MPAVVARGLLCWGRNVPTLHEAPASQTGKSDPRKEPVARVRNLEAGVDDGSNRLKRYLNILGPGLIAGASDDDPSGIATYAVAGASLGYATLWTALVTLPLMSAVQFICAKVGMVSGMGLAGVMRQYYPRPLLYVSVLGLLVATLTNHAHQHSRMDRDAGHVRGGDCSGGDLVTLVL